MLSQKGFCRLCRFARTDLLWSYQGCSNADKDGMKPERFAMASTQDKELSK